MGFWLGLVWGGLLPGSASASPLLELVGDPGGDGGFAARYTGAGAFSTYFNPGLLPHADPQFSARLLLVSDPIEIHLAPRPGGAAGQSAVPESAAGAFHDDGNYTPVFPSPVPTAWLEEGCADGCGAGRGDAGAAPRPRQGVDSASRLIAYGGIGLVQPLVADKLVFGAALLVPLSNYLKAGAFYNDEREQYFSNSLHAELYSDRLTPLSMAFGFGSRVIESLSVGVSFSVQLNNVARSPTFVPEATAYEALELSNDVTVDTAFAPHFGVAFEPLERLLLTATLHTEQALTVDAAFSSFLPDGTERFALRRFTHHFVPLTAALGAGYSVPFGKHALAATVGASFERWSTYRDRHDERPRGAYAFSDIIHPSVALRYLRDPIQIGLDGTYFTSPVPDQTGRTNYVDNDRLGFGASARYDFELGGVRLRAGLSVQIQRLLARSQRKRVPALGRDDPSLVKDEVPDDAVEKRDIDDAVSPRAGLQTNNPGFPGFGSKGFLLSAGLNLEVLL